jgi:1-acyl-sn-glycerol-3-phosphate acyltransferase
MGRSDLMSITSRSVRNLRAISRALTWIANPAPVEGLHHVPPSGPYILAANHLGMLDLPLIYAEVGSDQLAGWVAEKWEHHWLLGRLMRAGNGIFIQRGEIDRAALDAAVAWLQSGRIFGMAPEGTRSRSGGLGRGKTGIVYIAHKAEVPILPAVCIGTEGAFASLLRLRRKRVAVRFGPVFRLPPVEASRRAESTRQQADEVMCHLAALLPESYRGAYRHHPGVQALAPPAANH